MTTVQFFMGFVDTGVDVLKMLKDCFKNMSCVYTQFGLKVII